MENSLKTLVNYLKENVVDINDDIDIANTLKMYIKNDINYVNKIKDIIDSHKDDEWEGSDIEQPFTYSFDFEFPNYDILDAIETDEIPNEFIVDIVSNDDCFRKLTIGINNLNGHLNFNDKTPECIRRKGSLNFSKITDDNSLADYYYDLGVKTGQKIYFEMAQRLKDSANDKAIKDIVQKTNNFKPFVMCDDGMHYLEDENKNSETPNLDAICYEVQGTIEDELDDPEEIDESEIDNLDDNQLLSVRIWDKNTGEDSTPHWLYTLLNDKIFADSDDFSESMECTYIMSVYDFKKFINYISGDHKFKVIKYTDKQAKSYTMSMWDDDFLKDHKVCFIYDANEEFLPDTTPEWLYDILNGSPSMGWSEFMESIFEVDNETYEYLINHPDCIESRDATNAEAYGNGDEYDEDEYGEDDEDNNYDDDEIKEKLSDIILNPYFSVKAGGRFAPKGGKDKLDLIPDLYKELYGEEIYDKKDIHEILAESPKMGQVRKDIKYDVDFENGYIDHHGTTKDGIDYLACKIFGDWEEPVAIFIYWDGKKYRGYVPTRGNAINTINRSAFGNDEDADNEYCTKYLGLKDYYGDDGCAFGLPINWDACLEEFETRLVVK